MATNKKTSKKSGAQARSEADKELAQQGLTGWSKIKDGDFTPFVPPMASKQAMPTPADHMTPDGKKKSRGKKKPAGQ